MQSNFWDVMLNVLSSISMRGVSTHMQAAPEAKDTFAAALLCASLYPLCRLAVVWRQRQVCPGLEHLILHMPPDLHADGWHIRILRCGMKFLRARHQIVAALNAQD